MPRCRRKEERKAEEDDSAKKDGRKAEDDEDESTKRMVVVGTRLGIQTDCSSDCSLRLAQLRRFFLRVLSDQGSTAMKMLKARLIFSVRLSQLLLLFMLVLLLSSSLHCL